MENDERPIERGGTALVALLTCGVVCVKALWCGFADNWRRMKTSLLCNEGNPLRIHLFLEWSFCLRSWDRESNPELTLMHKFSHSAVRGLRVSSFYGINHLIPVKAL